MRYIKNVIKNENELEVYVRKNILSYVDVVMAMSKYKTPTSVVFMVELNKKNFINILEKLEIDFNQIKNDIGIKGRYVVLKPNTENERINRDFSNLMDRVESYNDDALTLSRDDFEKALNVAFKSLMKELSDLAELVKKNEDKKVV